MRRSAAIVLALSALLAFPAVAHAAKRKPLAGTHRVKNLVLKRGTTYVARRDLTIVAKGTIVINGPIVTSPGVSVRLTAHGRIVNNAPIRPAPGSRLLAEAAAPAACGTEAITERSLVSDIVVNAEIVGADGLTGRDGKGCPGQDVFLLSVLGRVHVRAPIKAGAGGPGRSDRKPTTFTSTNACKNDHRSVMPLTGKPGGDGGSIEIRPRAPVARAGLLRPGKGGPGGDAGSSGVPTPAPNGTTGRAGADVIAASGAGGDAGSAYWDESLLSKHHPLAGAVGGRPGGIYVRAGDGGAPNCDGGQTDAILGESGLSSEGADGKRADPERAEKIDVRGGNAFAEPSQIAGQPGGRGGNIRLREQSRSGLVSAFSVKKIDVTSAANGGPGFMGCGSTIQSGTDGGSAGNLSLLVNAVPLDIRDSFNGATGGDGAPSFGFGGGPGVADVTVFGGDQTGSFRRGVNGTTCPNAAFEYRIDESHATWTNPFKDGAPVSATYAISLCGNPFSDNWILTGTSGGLPLANFLRFQAGAVHDTVPLYAYRQVDGSLVAEADVHFTIGGTAADITLSQDPAPIGSTGFLDLGPRVVELHGQFVGTKSDCH
jgi:hypothetical protein